MYRSTTPLRFTIRQCFVSPRISGFHADRGRLPQRMHLVRFQATASSAAVAHVFHFEWFISMWRWFIAWLRVLIGCHLAAQRVNTVPR